MYSKEAQRILFERSKELLKTSPAEPLDFNLASERVWELSNIIRYHEWRYYVQNDPVISDFEYDQLYKQLEAIETQYPDLITPDSPTQRVSPDLTENVEQVVHLTPMLSLDNSYDAEDLLDFDTSVKKLCSLPPDAEVEYAVEPKFDGGTIVRFGAGIQAADLQFDTDGSDLLIAYTPDDLVRVVDGVAGNRIGRFEFDGGWSYSLAELRRQPVPNTAPGFASMSTPISEKPWSRRSSGWTPRSLCGSAVPWTRRARG